MMVDETLSPQSKYGLLLASAIATRFRCGSHERRRRRGDDAGGRSSRPNPQHPVIAMNNVYYRFVHLVSNPEYKTMPARLRMNWLEDPRVDRNDFELWALAVSAINGCGVCMDAHEKALRQSGVSSDTIQTTVRFAAIVQSVAFAIEAAAGHGTPQGAE